MITIMRYFIDLESIDLLPRTFDCGASPKKMWKEVLVLSICF